MTVSVTETETTVEGTDAQSGERFEGTFHVMDSTSDRGMLGPAPAVGGGSVTPGMPPMPMTRTKGTIQMSGRLEGSKGTSLRCAIQIERTLSMRGSGTCVQVDVGESGPTYRLRF